MAENENLSLKESSRNKSIELPIKVKIDKENKEFDPRNPQIVLESLEGFLEEDDNTTLKDYLKVSPWTLTELRRYAKTDPRFKSILLKAEKKGVQTSKYKAPILKNEDAGQEICSSNKPVEEKKVPVKKRELTPSETENILKHSANRPYQRLDLVELEGEDDSNFEISICMKKDLSSMNSFADLTSRWTQTTGLSDLRSGVDLLNSMVNSLSGSNDVSKDHVKNTNKLARLMREFEPRDAIESSLCSQIVICQEKGFSTLGLAAIQKDQKWIQTFYNISSKLLARSQSALQQLISYRREADQRITVEHVNMAPGSKAIFGNVSSDQGGTCEKNKSNQGSL